MAKSHYKKVAIVRLATIWQIATAKVEVSIRQIAFHLKIVDIGLHDFAKIAKVIYLFIFGTSRLQIYWI